VPKRRAAQGLQHFGLAAGEIRSRNATKLDRLVRSALGPTKPPDTGASRAEAQHVAVQQDASTHRAAIHSRAVRGQAEIGNVDMGPAANELSVQSRHTLVFESDVNAFTAADGRNLRRQFEHLSGVFDA
jgi:hypothetical protein